MIHPLMQLNNSKLAREQIYEIFFESAVRQDFDSEKDRLEFRNIWLDRYLTNFKNQVYVYTGPDEVVLGYLTGCNDSVGACKIFDDIHFYSELAPYYLLYPAHFHINVRSEFRSRGIGQQLVQFYTEKCSEDEISGVHIVTAQNSRNVNFYRKCELNIVTTVDSPNRNLVMMGRLLRVQHDTESI